ncbi:DUF4145 domain-containing protein [Peribacillus frigoritolerans]|uniref:DUF4145 domain-containing protein n=1 Tax=Peribacillus frigoritolerans TaxID=450367 RepID=UPI003D07F694
MHNHSLFEFVGQFSSELFELVCRIENQLLDQPLASLIQARLYTEQLVKIISKEEGIEDIYPLKHSERIHKLYRQNAVEEDIYLKLEWIRKKGNKAAHDINEVNINDVLQVHKFLFEISVWYMQVYVSYDFEAPIYKLPIKTAQETNPLGAEDLEVLIKPYVDQTMQKMDEMWAEVQRELEAIKGEKKRVHTEATEDVSLQQLEIAATSEKEILASSQENQQVLGVKQIGLNEVDKKFTLNIETLTIDTVMARNNFKLTKKTKKATEFEHMKNGEVLYLMPYKDISIVLNPKTVENNPNFKGGKESHSTALTQFPKKIKNGKTPTSYGYSFKFKTEGELDAFLKKLNV